MKYKLLRFSLLSILVMLCGMGVYADNALTIDFESELTVYSDWEFSNIASKQTNSNVSAHGGSYFGNTDGKTTCSITTKDKIASPQSIVFYISKQSTNTSASTWNVQVSSDGATWTVLKSQSAGSGITRGTWTEVSQDLSAQSDVFVRITYDGTTAIRTIDDITLTYADASDTRTETTLTLGEYQTSGYVNGSMNLPIVTVTAGTTTLNNPSISWESSNSDVAIIADGKINLLKAGTSNIKASFDGDDDYKGSSASFTLTVTKAPYTSFSALQADATSTSTPVAIQFNGQQVVYVNSGNAFLADSDGNGLLVYTSNHGLEAGQKLSGTLNCNLTLYQGNTEITGFSKEGLTITSAAVAPIEKTIAEIQPNNQSTLVTLKGLTCSVTTEGNKTTYTLSDGENSIVYFDKFKTNVVPEDGKKYDVTGIVVLYNSTIEICPRTADDVVEVATEPAEFQDFAVIVNNQTGTLLTSEEQVQGTAVEFGVAVDAEGKTYRVDASDVKSIATVSGNYHSDHGMTGMKVVVAVPGAVKILVGQCTFSSNDIKVSDSNGDVVVTATPTTACWKNDPKNVTELIYKGEATTLTITGMGYCPFISVETVDPSQLVTDATVTFAAGEAGNSAFVPEKVKQEVGKKITLPQNYTMYVEGKTLTAWSDGENNYAPGAEYTVPENDVTLTAVFTANEASLADRTAPVTVKWNFRRDQGAPAVGWEGQTGLVWVTQAEVNGKTIDVALPFSTSPGKFNNKNNNDWVQINNGTTFNVPSCKGATISMEAYSDITTTTIDGQTDYTQGKTISYTIAGSVENVDVVIGDGSYYRYIQVILPVVQSQGGGESYENEVATVVWPFTDSSNMSAYTSTPDGVFSTIAANTGDITLNGTGTGQATYPDGSTVTFVKLRPAGSTQAVEWALKPAAGLTFTPTKISAYIARFGTDAENGITITAKAGEGETITLGNFTAPRNNKTQAEDKYGKNSNYTNQFIIELTTEQQAALASADGLSVFGTVGVASGKDGGYAEMTIEGLINGTATSVSKYTLATAMAPEDAGSINVYPEADEYEEGSTIKLTATENFGYDFVNWTDAEGEVVSTEPVYTFDIAKNETLTANFEAVETYELALTVDGTNDYMVTIDPAPTMVAGKMMYEAGTAVKLTANQYEGLVTFNNWSDSDTKSEKLFSMTAEMELTAVYSQADIIAGWDFYKKGNEGRIADFASEMNTTSALSLVNTESGDAKGWLDKSTEAANGYESFKGAAVNWTVGDNDGDVGHYHWQTKVNAKDFTDINVQFQMLYNYNAYQTYDAEYSLNGEEWTKFGSITMTGTKAPASFNGTLPEACNNTENLFIRMIADKASKVDGSASANDGNTLAMFFITGTQALVDDGKAPELVSTVPAAEADGVSANGKIVLTFNEKVMVSSDAAATLGSQNLTPVVSGKTISFEYKGLEYSTEYTFTLPIYTVSDLTNNAIDVPISFSFTTMERPTVTKGLYDAVVGNVDELIAAINEANSRSDKTTRYRIFLKKGTYKLPTGATKHYKHTNNDGSITYWEGDLPDPITYISAANISFIGEDRDATIVTQNITNDENMLFEGQFGKVHKYEEIGNSAVLQLEGTAKGSYFQDVTVKSGINDGLGRNLAVHDMSSQTIYKNTLLYGYQDTWTSNSNKGLFYFEGGQVRGRTDFLCGKGDAFFNGVELLQLKGGYAAVPSTPANIGWVFKDCVISGGDSGVDGNYTLGRPWGNGTPVAVFIDTKMNVVPSAIGWNEMSNGWPKRFAEFNSMTKTGGTVDLSGRKKTFGNGHENNPVLTAAEALAYSDMSKMFGEWDPTLATEQAPVPQNVKQEGNSLVWDNSNYALLWAIVKDGAVIDFTTEPTYELTESGTYAVRAANEMGGLSEASESVEATVTEVVKVTLNASGYATLASANALDFSTVEGLTAYIVKEQTADKAILTSVTTTPAETGLVLKGAADTEYTIPVATSATSIEGNLLVAAVNGATVDTKSVYVLDGDKFKVFAGTEIPAGKAYLPMNGNARLLELVFDDATAIGSVNVDVNANQIYDLQGRRVKTPSKGVYVVDGKKVIIK